MIITRHQPGKTATNAIADFLLCYEMLEGPFGCEVIMADGREVIGVANISLVTKDPELIVEGYEGAGFTEFIPIEDIKAVVI